MKIEFPTDVRPLLTVKEVCGLTGISRPKLYQLIHTQNFPTIRIGRAVRIPVAGLKEWLESQQQN